MALDDDSVLNISTGHLYRGAVGALFLADPRAPGVAWTELGHSSPDDILTFSSDGGDSTVLSSLQSKSLRTSTTPRIERLQISLYQYDTDTLKLFYGSNATVDATGDYKGLLGVPDDPTPTQAAFLAVFYDGEETVALYAPKSEIIRNGDLTFASSTDLSSIPLQVTPLNLAGAKKMYFLPVDAVLPAP